MLGKEKVSVGVNVARGLAVVWNVWIEATTLALLWAWFAVPLGLPAIGKAHAYGLALLVCMTTSRWHYQEEDTDERALQQAAWLFITPLLFLLFGYLCHRAMLP